MTTYNTGNPIGSTDARDRLDNSENMDILENSTTLNAHADRLGTMRKTRKGMELEHDNQISAHEVEHDSQISAHEAEHDNQMQSFENDFDSRLAGMAFTRVGTFTTGATLTDMRQTLLWEVSQGGDGHEYGWIGSFPKVVPPASTPAGTGGIGAGAWVNRTDARPDVEERLLGVGAKIYRGSNWLYVQNGDVVPVGTTHLIVLINGKPEIVVMSPIASGEVSLLSNTYATIGWTSVVLASNGNGGVYTINAEAWGIVLDDADHLPPYTTQEYNNAYNNGKVIERIVKFCSENGYSEVVLPWGRITVCYEHITDTAFQTHGVINLDSVSDISINLNGCLIDVIYDSENKSPYDTSLNPAWQLDGNVFLLDSTKNVEIFNGEIKGDCYKRAWVSGEEAVEQTYGIYSLNGVFKSHFHNLKVHGFAGDGFTGNGLGSDNRVVIPSTFTKGNLSPITGLPFVTNGAYYSDQVSISGLNVIDGHVRLVGGGYLRRYQARHKEFLLIWYDSSDVVVKAQKVEQLMQIFVPTTASYFRVVFYNDERTDATVTYSGYMLMMSGLSSGQIIENCHIFNNHRGGISNGPCDSVIRQNHIYSNGRGEDQGWPLFNDNTRYAVNYEDGMVDNVLLDGNTVFDHLNTFLLSVYRGEVRSHQSASGDLGLVEVYESELVKVHDNDFTRVSTYSLISNLVNSNRTDASIERDVNVHVYNNTGYNIGLTNGPTKIRWTVTDNEIKNGRQAYGNGTYKGNKIHVLDSNYDYAVAQKQTQRSVIDDTFISENTIGSTNTGYRRYSLVDTIKSKDEKIRVFSEQQVNIEWGITQVREEVSYIGKIDIESDGIVFLNVALTDVDKPALPTQFINIFGIEVDATSLRVTPASAGGTLYTRVMVEDSIFDNTVFQNYIDTDAGTQRQLDITFSNCTFILDDVSDVLFNRYSSPAQRTFRFVNCTFRSLNTKNIKIISSVKTTVSSEAIGCSFLNVTNTDGITVIS